jgi:hypothetical protein
MQLQNQLQQQMADFTQNNVYPSAQIEQAQQMAEQCQAQATQIQNTIDLTTNSAQLPTNQQF